MAPRITACAACWTYNRKCKRELNGCCPTCLKLPSLAGKQVCHDGSVMQFPLRDLQDHMRLVSVPLESPDTEYYAWHIVLDLQNKATEDIYFPIYPRLNDCDDGLQMVDWDGFILSHFTATLRAKTASSAVIQTAIRASGYIYCLLSPITPLQRMTTTQDGSNFPLLSQNLDLASIFKCRLFLQLGTVVEHLLARIRTHKSDNSLDGSEIHAATVILLHEVGHIHESLKKGTLQSFFCSRLSDVFLRWVQSVKVELSHRIRAECGKFLSWQDPVQGPVNQLKHRHRQPKFRITINLEQHLKAHFGIPREIPSLQAPAIEPFNLDFGLIGHSPAVNEANKGLGQSGSIFTDHYSAPGTSGEDPIEQCSGIFQVTQSKYFASEDIHNICYQNELDPELSWPILRSQESNSFAELSSPDDLIEAIPLGSHSPEYISLVNQMTSLPQNKTQLTLN